MTNLNGFPQPNEEQQNFNFSTEEQTNLPQPENVVEKSMPVPTQLPTTTPPINNTQQPTQTTNQPTQVMNSNPQQNTQTQPNWIRFPKYMFYTGSSALGVTYIEQALFFETAPSIGQRRYDWQNQKINVKMSIEEIDQILECLRAYKTGGIQAFQNMAQFLQPKNQQPGTLNFYHPTEKATTTILVYISKSGIPSILFNRNEGNVKKTVNFPIIPSALPTFIRVLDVYASEALKLNKRKQNQQSTSGGNQ